MKTIDDLKQYCLKEMEYHRDLVTGAKAAGKHIIAVSNQGSVDALHDIYQKLCIYFHKEKGS